MIETGHPYRDRVSKIISWGHWFSLFNILLALAVGSRYIFLTEQPSTLLAQIYMLISWIGHFSFLPFALYLLVLFPLSFVLPFPGFMRAIGVLIGTSAVTLLAVDTQIFDEYRFHLNPLVLELLVDVEKLDIASSWRLLFVFVPLLFLLQLTAARLIWNSLEKLQRMQIGVPLASLFMVCFLLSHMMHIWADANVYRPITLQKSNYPLSYPMTAKSFMAKRGWLNLQDIENKEKSRTGSESLLSYPRRELEPSGNINDLNILMITIQSLRQDAVSLGRMPNLSLLAEQSSNYQNHISGSNEHHLGLFSMFYGIPNQYWTDILANSVSPVMVDLLQENDYQIGLFSGSHLRDRIYRLATFSQVEPYPQTDNGGGHNGDAQAIEQWRQWLSDTEGGPWFSYISLNGIRSFGGKNAKAGQAIIQKMLKGEDASEQLQERYYDSARELDTQLGLIFNELQVGDRLENTIVIITSDHGFEFNETRTNSWGYGSNYSTYQLQVPLIISWPGKKPQEIMLPTSHADIVPTLMQGVFSISESPRNYSMGQNLTSKPDRDWLLTGNMDEYVVYESDRIIVLSKLGDFHTYDRATYQTIENSRPEMTILVQVLNELKRFYKH